MVSNLKNPAGRFFIIDRGMDLIFHCLQTKIVFSNVVLLNKCQRTKTLKKTVLFPPLSKAMARNPERLSVNDTFSYVILLSFSLTQHFQLSSLL